jgi:MoxR-like ATPase/DNA-binding XRE family transcriptional regulator
MNRKVITTPEAFRPRYGLPFAISPDGSKLRFLDEVVDRAIVNDPDLRRYIPSLENLAHTYALDQRTAELVYKIIKNYKHRTPILLEGETATSKSSAIMFAAALLNLPVCRINFSKQTDLSELLGKFVPNSSAAEKELWGIFHADDISGYKPETQKIIQKYRYTTDGKFYTHTLDNEDDLRRVAELEGIRLSDKPFVWQEGILPFAMKKGCLLLLDELNLMPAELLAALNPALEDNPTLLIPNILEIISPGKGLHKNFFVAATQNPTAYEGRQKLPSDLLRRFGFQLQVDLPTQEEINEMIIFLIYGKQPRFIIRNTPYQAKDIPTAFPTLAQYPDLAGLIGNLARFHTEIQTMLAKRILNRDRKQKLVLTRRDISSFLAFLENYRSVDNAGNIFGFLDQPEYILNKALDFYYTNHFQIDRSDFVKIKELKENIFGRTVGEIITGSPASVALRLSVDGEYLYIQDQILTRRGNLSAADQEHLPGDQEALCLDESTTRYLANLALAINLRQPVLVEGPTATAKTSGIRYLARQLNQPILRFNLSGQSETAELIGKYVPANQELAEKYLAFFDHKSGYIFTEKSQAILNKVRGEKRQLRLNEVIQVAQNEGLNIQDAKWQWQKGPLIIAMEKGYWIILDELNQADTNILERLNSLLEENPTFLVSENGGATYSWQDGTINPHFRIFATMNPAEYHGKKALSPAFLNRWTAYFQLTEPSSEELSQMLKFLIYGEQPGIRVTGSAYTHDDPAPSQYPKLSQLLNVFLDNNKGLFDQIAKFHAALARDLSPDARQRKLAQDKPELVLTRSELKKLLDRMEQGEKVLEQMSFWEDNAAENILGSALTRREIILKALAEIYLDRFSGQDKMAVHTLLEAHGLTAETYAYNNILVSQAKTQALANILSKYTNLRENLQQTIADLQTKENATRALTEISEIQRDLENESAGYKIQDEPQIQQLTASLDEIAAAITARRNQLVNNDAFTYLAKTQEILNGAVDVTSAKSAAPLSDQELKTLYNSLSNVELGRRVLQARHVRGYNQKSFGLAIHIATTTLGSIEKGRERVSFELLKRIADACQITLERLLTGDL